GAYRRALADALRAGRPQPFLVERDPLGVVARDTAAVATALAGLADADAGVGRVSAEVLEQVARPEHRDALVAGPPDEDGVVPVRAVAPAALSSSGRPEARAALLSLAERERDEVLGDLPYAAARPADERARLVADALRHRARGHGRRAIAAALALTGRMPDELVLEALERDDAARRASALELVETATDPGITRPLLPLWEGGAAVDARDTARLLR